MNIIFSFYVNSKYWLCTDGGKVVLYKAYTCTTVTAQAFNYDVR